MTAPMNPLYSNKLFDTNFQLVMFMHTNLRNVALFTSVSVACLTYAGRIGQRPFLLYLFLLFISMSLLIVAYLLNRTLNSTLTNTIDKFEGGVPGNIMMVHDISYYMFIVHYIFIFIGMSAIFLAFYKNGGKK